MFSNFIFLMHIQFLFCKEYQTEIANEISAELKMGLVLPGSFS